MPRNCPGVAAAPHEPAHQRSCLGSVDLAPARDVAHSYTPADDSVPAPAVSERPAFACNWKKALVAAVRSAKAGVVPSAVADVLARTPKSVRSDVCRQDGYRLAELWSLAVPPNNFLGTGPPAENRLAAAVAAAAMPSTLDYSETPDTAAEAVEAPLGLTASAVRDDPASDVAPARAKTKIT